MENLLKNTTALARAVCQNYIDAFRKSADKNGPLIAVDATCGNGHDALWLAEVCDRVYAFDIQPEAVKTTAELLGAHNRSGKVELFCKSHADMKSRVPEKAAVIVFNLGYLPGGDKEITTHTESTLCALQAALELLRVDGLLCVTVYWGHPSGREEREAVLRWAKNLDKGIYHCVHTDMLNQPNCPPEILFVTRKKSRGSLSAQDSRESDGNGHAR